jgi:hypothetical protein
MCFDVARSFVVALRFVFVTTVVSGQQDVEMVDYLCKNLMIPYWYEYVDVGIPITVK